MRLLPLVHLPLVQVAVARSKVSDPELAFVSIVIGKMVYLHKQSQILTRDLIAVERATSYFNWD